MITFGNLLDLAGISRSSVRLLRHQDNRHPGFPTPYVLWRDHRGRFEAYQETQGVGDAPDLRAPYWASFVGVPGKETLFVGLYSAELIGPLAEDRSHPVTGGIEAAGSCNEYRLALLPELANMLAVSGSIGARAIAHGFSVAIACQSRLSRFAGPFAKIHSPASRRSS